MFKHQEVWLPDGETHLTHWMDTAGEIVDGKGSYQIKKLRAALSLCTQFRTAVDVGAHCGLWSMQLVKRFAHVEAFEPVAAHRECFAKNVFADHEEPVRSEHRVDGVKATLHACALGDHEDMINITTEPTSSGDSRVNGPGDIPMHTLDSFNLQDVGLIKLDTEGHEYFVLRGARETLLRCRPVVIVEQKPGHAQRHGIGEKDALPLLEGLGAKLRKEISGDFIYTWD